MFTSKKVGSGVIVQPSGELLQKSGCALGDSGVLLSGMGWHFVQETESNKDIVRNLRSNIDSSTCTYFRYVFVSMLLYLGHVIQAAHTYIHTYTNAGKSVPQTRRIRRG